MIPGGVCKYVKCMFGMTFFLQEEGGYKSQWRKFRCVSFNHF